MANWVIFLFFINLLIRINGQVLNPPYFNIAEGRKINASSTCGEGQRDLYCRLVGSNFGFEQVSHGRLIMGQSCDWCDSTDLTKSHKAEYITDGTDRWWQSPPLSRDLKYVQVNLTLDLGQEFHIAYVLLKMGNSPRPDVWVLERSNDFGATWSPWQYFAPTKEDCVKFFGNASLEPVTRDDSVTCVTKFSKIVPLEHGEITVKLVTDRPGASNFSMSPTLQAWSKATNIRLRFLRPKTTLEDLVEGTRRDKTVTRRYFYSLQDMNIGGRCVCNGHANVCNILDPHSPFKLYCKCKHNTCGAQCNQCCAGYTQKKWRPATVEDPFQCEPCNCFGHSEECFYDEQVDIDKKSIDIHGNNSGGGVCRNCRDNTKGINCNECIDGFYRKPNTPLDSKEICSKCECNKPFHTGNCAPETGQCECRKNFNSPNCDSCSFGYVSYPTCRPCDCFINGTTSEQCEFTRFPNAAGDEFDVQCSCKENYAGRECRKCAPKFYDFPNCTSCDCEPQGSVSEICDEVTGKCECKNNYDGTRCERCREGYYGYPTCSACNCDVTGTTQQICDAKDGKCICREGFAGDRCDQCELGYYGYPNCQPCNCNERGSLHSFCSSKNGKCACLSNYDSRNCGKCKPGFYNENGNCVSCSCDIHGSLGLACDSQGKCTCKENYDGDKCDRCKKTYYVYPFCERCECNLNGIKDSFSGCNQFSTIEKLCECKERVTGRKCERCKSLYWKLYKYNPLGCQECQCSIKGTLSGLGVCHTTSGQCVCKNAITGRVCNDCKDGYWKEEEGNHFGCSACECSPGGSEHPFCLKQSGKCSCRPKITGRTCDRPVKSHYLPTLYQLTYEMEDAMTPQSTQARYDYNEQTFPEFSWKGYANYSEIQKDLYMDIQIDQPSIYRPVINYINFGNEPINGQLVLTPLSPSISQEIPQTIQFQLESTNDLPKKYLLPVKVGVQSFLTLKPGKWRMNLKLDKPALVDYVVLLPDDYWNAQVPIEQFELPCVLIQQQEPNRLCKHYGYPKYTKNSTILTLEQLASNPNYYRRADLVERLTKNPDVKPILVTEVGQEYKFTPKSNGKHMIVINYHHFDLVDETNIQDEHRLNRLDLKLKKLTNNALEPVSEDRIPEENKNSIKVDPTKNRTLYEKFLQNFVEHKISNEEPVTVDLTKCIYSFSCRQVVKTLEHDIAVFELSNKEEYQLTVKPSEKSKTDPKNLPALIDLTLIPFDDWSLDYVRGDVICSRNSSGFCIPNEFLDNEHDNNQMRFIDRSDEPQSELEKEQVYKIDDNNLIDLKQANYFDSSQLSVIASGNVTEPKLYTFVVEYFQPHHATYDIQSNIILNGGTKKETFIPSKIPIKYCPDVSGCKTQIVTTTNGTLFELNDAFDLAVAFPPDKSIHIKKINVIRNDNFANSLLNAQPTLMPQVDFYKECGQDAFYINNTLYNKYWNQTSNSLIIPEDPEEQMEAKKVSKFCRDAIFGLAVKFNKGALPCNCDQRGSTSYDCDHFGGQCPCRPNVIGRTCSACKISYYGFPNCKPCNCPSTSAYCEPKTGKCICPPRVTGPKCDTCVALTFGYHHLNGCEECKCSSTGVLNGNLQCDIITGACECKKNIAGRRCNHCVNGFYSFPQCMLCSCDKRGATEQICDSSNGKCFCKPNTIGDSCDQCKADSFHLEESNPLGCSKCWCAGVSSKCRSSDYVYVQQIDMLNQLGVRTDMKAIEDKKNALNSPLNNDGWTASKLVFVTEKSFNEYVLNSIEKYKETTQTNNESSTRLMLDQEKVTAYLPESERKEISLNQEPKQNSNLIYGYYFRLPSSYLGKKLTSYGGQLSYSVTNSIEDNYEGVFTGPDIILIGNNVTMIHEILEQPLSPNERHSVNLTLTEKSFKLLNGATVARDKFLNLLLNITSIYLKGAYFKYTSRFSLSNVSIDIGQNDPLFKTDSSIYAKSVEQCFCPKGYKGSSCEQCSEGYYRTKVDGKGLGYCIPCKCNGHSQECDVNTGVCFGCMHNTTGDHCEKCVAGYHGDATRGSPLDCMICPCPLAQESNNFALSCQMSSFDPNQTVAGSSSSLTTQFTCTCKPGYTGPICSQCDTGYYGRPFVSGDYCKPCNCSGNADLSIPGACDTTSGRCLLCSNNTYGDQCEVCAPNYFGDAINLKNCRRCACSKCGTTKCDNVMGICECKQNVIGEHCNECDINHWGFESCNGCKPCNCGVGSNSSQCDLLTGSCFCKVGVTGEKCDRCMPGFFNLTSEGCTDCNCTKKYSLGTVCDTAGQCRCLPGVIGERCDGCPPRWRFVPGVGCQPCGNCIHGLLDFIDELKVLLDDVMNDMGDSSSSMFANRRLSRVNETIISNKNRLAEIFNQMQKDSSSVESLQLLRELQRNGNDIESLAKKLIDLKHSLLDQTKFLANDTKNCSFSTYHIHTAIFNAKEKLIKEIQWVKSLANTLIPAKIVNEETIVQKGQIIMAQLKQIDLTDNLKQVYEHLNASNELNERVIRFQEPWLNILNDMQDIEGKIERFNNLITDLNRWTGEANDKTVRLEQNFVGLTNTYREILQVNKKLNDLNGTISNLLQKAKEQNEHSRKVFDEELSNLNVDKQYEELLVKFDKMQEQRTQLTDEMEKLQKLIIQALTNVDYVSINATKIVNSFKETKSYSSDSVKAANSFSQIKDTIEDSSKSIDSAETKIREANGIFEFGNKTERSKAHSYDLKTSAINNQVKINNEIGVKLNATKNRLDDLTNRLDNSFNAQKNIQKHTSNLQNPKIKQLSDSANGLSDQAIRLTSNHKDRLNEKEKALLDQLESQTNEFDGKIKNGSSALKGILIFHKAIDLTLPNLLTKLEKTPAKVDKINKTQTQLIQLLLSAKKQVRSARAIANRIDLGLEIKPNTFVELRAPQNLLKPGTYTKLSLYFRPFVANGLIAYLGNPKSIRSTAHNDQYQKSLLNDFLALELRGKRVAMVMDVGSEALVVLHDQQVALNEWHFIEVEIIGKHVQLKLRSAADQVDKTLIAHLEGTFTVFNLDKLNSKFYLGGIPKNIEIQDKIENVDFDGEIQQVTLGDSKLGLWNFVSGKNNNKGIYKKEAAFKNANVGDNSPIKFNGKAYAQLSGADYDLRRQTDVFMQFKTLSNEGLIFLIRGKSKYLSIEIEQGRLVTRIDLESGSATLKSKEFVNDGNWHQLGFERLDKEILLKLDGKEVESKIIDARDLYLETDEHIYFGGYPNSDNLFDKVTKVGFNGCLRDIQVGSKLVKLDKDDRNVSPGVEFGCTENVVRELSFERAGFITMPLKHEINQISLKFRTRDQNGILFFVSNREMTQYLVIYLNRGILVFHSQPGEIITSSTHTERQFNDNNWHYLTATRTQNIMRLDLDDKYVYQPQQQQRNNKLILYDPINLDDDSVYFGGINDNKREKLESMDIPSSFIGCLGDVNLNEEFQNFALSKLKRNVQLVSCLKEGSESSGSESEEIPTVPDFGYSTPSVDEDSSPFLDPRKAITTSTEATTTMITGTITTTTSTITSTEKPEMPGKLHRPVRGCKLPSKPNDARLAASINGLKYGEKPTSRTEVKLEEKELKEIEKNTKIELKFDSKSDSGLLILLVDNKFIDHTLVILNKRKLYCSFNLGSGILKLESDIELPAKEGQWNRVSIVRESRKVKLFIDDKEVKNGTLPGDKTSLNVNPVLYVGGVPNELIESVSSKIEGNMYQPFVGCIKDVKLNSDLHLLDLDDSFDGVESCDPDFPSVEEGIFFNGQGYLQLKERFWVGHQKKFSIEVKPRTKNGVILYAKSSKSSTKDFILLELANGVLQATVNNGGNTQIQAKIELPSDELCDGEWHVIQLIKVANLLVLYFDEHTSGPVMDTGSEDFVTDTELLYIGSFPNDLPDKPDYLENATGYTGCIKSFKIETKDNRVQEKSLDLKEVNKYGDIELKSCPTT